MHSRPFKLDIDVEPAAVGMNNVHVYATTPDGHDATILEWRVSATNPALGLGPIDTPVYAVSSGHAVGTVDLPAAGAWRFSATVRGRGTGEDVGYADIQIT
jgi:copper transport protein